MPLEVQDGFQQWTLQVGSTKLPWTTKTGTRLPSQRRSESSSTTECRWVWPIVPRPFRGLCKPVWTITSFRYCLCIVYSNTFDEHIERLDRVFTRLREHALKLKPEKCHFLRRKVTYVGHQISSEPWEDSSCIPEWKLPTTVKKLRSFLGFCSYYRRFVKDFARIAGPLHQLVNNCLHEMKVEKKLKVPFVKRWNSECQTAFDALKTKLTHPPILGFADYSKPFIVETDASHVGLGAVLSQDQDGQRKLIAYASRRLRTSERNPRNYSSMKLELLVLKWAVTEKFRTYLLGSKFDVYTDNNPLKYLQTTAKLGALEQRYHQNLPRSQL